MTQKHAVGTALVTLAALAGITAAAWATRHWVFTAIPVGVLFGFFLQKGDLCGSSAFSEVVLFRDARKIRGLWMAIVVSMASLAAGDLLGWIQLNPKPLAWASVLVGGAVFGVGMVLAGGCVSGCLFKGAAGNLNAVAALIAMPFGIALVEYGPLHPLHLKLKVLKVSAERGGPVTLSSLTGLPFWALALAFAAATAAAALLLHRRGRTAGPGEHPAEDPHAASRILGRSWKPWAAGIAIGLLALPATLSSAASGRNYPLGVTHGVLHTALLITDAPVRHVVAPPSPAPDAPASKAPKPRKKVVWWLVLMVGGLVIGSHLSGRMSGQAKLLPKPPEQILTALGGGFLVGAGAALAGGCVVGNILSGWALMSVGTMLFGVVTILANWAATFLYLRGLR